jgi:hypothetical protein
VGEFPALKAIGFLSESIGSTEGGALVAADDDDVE